MKTGIYVIKHPLFFILRPRLILYKNKKNKLRGRMKWFLVNKPLKLVKSRKNELLFTFHVDIVHMDMVVKFYSQDAFEGFLDTPIGHFHFGGQRIK